MDNLELFKQSFREEAREVLVDLEAALLELNEKREDCEVVGRVFRGLHTLKGSGAMFGFEELAAFTHDLESAFDAVRNGRLEVSGELVDLTLASLDQIKSMLDQSVVVDAAAISRRSRLLTEIRHLAGLAQTAAPGLKSALEPIPKSGENEPRQEWRVTFAPGPDLLMNGTNPLLLLRELRQLGGLSVRASMAAVPPFAELEPERCYVSWEMVLSMCAGADAIRDVFIFVEDSCALTIESMTDAPMALEENPAGAETGQKSAIGAGRPSNPGGRRAEETQCQVTSLRVPAAKLDQFVDLVGEW